MESWGWPMGPSYLLDVAGLDTLDKALVILGKAYPEVMGTDFETAIQKLAGQMRYGQKTGAGFFRYEPDAKGRPFVDPAIRRLDELLATVQPQGRRAIDDEEILDRMMLAMILEAGRCLDEQVADSALEIDAGMRLGTGFQSITAARCGTPMRSAPPCCCSAASAIVRWAWPLRRQPGPARPGCAQRQNLRLVPLPQAPIPMTDKVLFITGAGSGMGLLAAQRARWMAAGVSPP